MNFHTFFCLVFSVFDIFALNLVKVKRNLTFEKTNTPYILKPMECLVWRVGEMIECVLFLFIMRWLGGLSWCDSVLSANQSIFMWRNFYVGGCIYYIGAIISHDGASFFLVVGGCMGLICFCRPVAANWFEKLLSRSKS